MSRKSPADKRPQAVYPGPAEVTIGVNERHAHIWRATGEMAAGETRRGAMREGVAHIQVPRGGADSLPRYCELPFHRIVVSRKGGLGIPVQHHERFAATIPTRLYFK